MAQAQCRRPGSACTCSWFLQICFYNILRQPERNLPAPQVVPSGTVLISQRQMYEIGIVQLRPLLPQGRGLSSAQRGNHFCRVSHGALRNRGAMFHCLRPPAHGQSPSRACVEFSLHRFPLWGTAPKFSNALLGLTGFTTSSELPALWKQYVLNISLRFPLQRAPFAVGPDGAASQGQTDRTDWLLRLPAPWFCGPAVSCHLHSVTFTS